MSCGRSRSISSLLEILQVEVSEAKSVISDNRSAEFAKRVYLLGGGGVFSAKWVAGVNHALLFNALIKRVRDKRQVRPAELLRLAGRGYRCTSFICSWQELSRRNQRTMIVLTSPESIADPNLAFVAPGLPRGSSAEPRFIAHMGSFL